VKERITVTNDSQPSDSTTALAWSDDPRIDDDHVRVVSGTGGRGDVLIVGVVHDHPASVYRARRVVSVVDPAVLALELPQLAVRLFRRYAAEEKRPPRSGGEMSAAVQAATGRVVGIDAPSTGFAVDLAGRLRREVDSVRTVRRVLGETARLTTHAMATYAAGVTGVEALTSPWRDGFDTFETERSPEQQAAHERRHRSRGRLLSSAFEAPTHVRLLDEVRENVMARRIAALAVEGDVVAVVGHQHLEPLADRLVDGPD
jgi:pheromone shutdown protein TraB